MHRLAICKKTVSTREHFDAPHVWHNKGTFPQNAQKDFSPPLPGAPRGVISKQGRSE